MNGTPLMAPFRGERYADADSLSRRLAPPYDVITPALRSELAALDPANIVHVDLPVALQGRDPYREAAALLHGWRTRGILVRDREACAYVLRTVSTSEDGRIQARTGVFLAVAAEPFSAGRILPHERTHEGPKEDRRRLTHATGCNLSPVFLLAPDSSGELEVRLADVTKEKPWTRAEAVGATHEVWVVGGERARQIAAVAGAEPTYVADGHHRFETAVLFRDEAPHEWRAGAARTLAHVVSFRDLGLQILPTHRIVEGRPLASAAVLAAASPYFRLAQGARWATLTAVFGDGTEAPLALRGDADLAHATDLPAHPAVRSLAVAIADAVFLRVIVARLVGGAPALRYTASAGEARAAARESDVALAILLPSTRLEEVRRVADAGQIMPPKSTFFVPKVPTGVVLRPLDGQG